MNLIDFKVTKILSEEYAPMYQLFGMTEDEVKTQALSDMREDGDLFSSLRLFANGCKQTYEYCDVGGTHIDTVYFNIDQGDKPFCVGDIGQH